MPDSAANILLGFTPRVSSRVTQSTALQTWSKSALEEMLGGPDQIAPNPHYSSSSPMRLYEKERLYAFEETLEFGWRHKVKPDHPQYTPLDMVARVKKTIEAFKLLTPEVINSKKAKDRQIKKEVLATLESLSAVHILCALGLSSSVLPASAYPAIFKKMKEINQAPTDEDLSLLVQRFVHQKNWAVVREIIKPIKDLSFADHILEQTFAPTVRPDGLVVISTEALDLSLSIMAKMDIEPQHVEKILRSVLLAPSPKKAASRAAILARVTLPSTGSFKSKMLAHWAQSVCAHAQPHPELFEWWFKTDNKHAVRFAKKEIQALLKHPPKSISYVGQLPYLILFLHEKGEKDILAFAANALRFSASPVLHHAFAEVLAMDQKCVLEKELDQTKAQSASGKTKKM